MLHHNLIVCCVGDESTIEQWCTPDRTWDLFLIYYGHDQAAAEKYSHRANFFVHKQGYKYELARTILVGWQGYINYNYIWFPDCDLEISSSATQRMFELAEQRGAEIFTPAIGNRLYPERFDPQVVWASWTPLIVHEGTTHRRISHPESMMPGFSRWAWENIFLRSLILFPFYRVGWGLESVWSALSYSYHLDKKLPNFVFDDIYVLHLKPVGQGSAALQELGHRELGFYRNAYFPIETVVLEEFPHVI